MVLPSEIFADVENIPSLENLPTLESDPVEAINSGNFDISDFIPDTPVVPTPPSTFYSAPQVSVAPEQQNTIIQQNTPGPTPEDQSKLDNLEQLLGSLDEQIKTLSADLDKDTTETKQKNEEILDKALMAPESNDEKSNPVQVVSPFKDINSFPGSETVLNKTTFNKEKLKEIEQQKETILKERETILKKFTEKFAPTENFQNTINNTNTELDEFNSNNTTNNTTEQDFTNLNNINSNLNKSSEQNISNLNNTFNSQISQAPEIVNDSIAGESAPEVSTQLSLEPTQNLLDQEAGNSFVENNSNESNSSTDILNTSNNMFENINNTFAKEEEQSIPELGATSTNIENNFINELGGEQDIENAFTSPGNTPEETLPPSRDNNADNVQNITGLLTGIKEGIGKLNDSLGSNFSNLNQSIQGIKSNVVNNNNNYGGGSKGGSSFKNNNTQQRPTMTEYRGDFPQQSDFPKGFDVTLLGGTNLSNPEQIS